MYNNAGKIEKMDIENQDKDSFAGYYSILELAKFIIGACNPHY